MTAHTNCFCRDMVVLAVELQFLACRSLLQLSRDFYDFYESTKSGLESGLVSRTLKWKAVEWCPSPAVCITDRTHLVAAGDSTWSHDNGHRPPLASEAAMAAPDSQLTSVDEHCNNYTRRASQTAVWRLITAHSLHPTNLYSFSPN